MKAEQRIASDGLIEQRIINGLAKILSREPRQVAKQSRLIEDLNIDSLDTLDLIFQLEEEFDIEIPTGDELRFRTVQDVINYVGQKLEGK